MLSGIKVGKKKRRKKTEGNSAPDTKPQAERPGVNSTATSNQSDNLSIAARLRESLATGGNLEAVATSSNQQQSFLNQLERRGRFESTKSSSTAADDVDALGANTIVQLPLGVAPTAKREEDMTVQELVAQERREKQQNISLDEQMTRNLARLGKKRRRDDKLNDSDDEVEKMKRWLPGAKVEAKDGSAKQQRAFDKAGKRDQHRLLHEKFREEKITSKCSWWMESSSFRKHRLLALGNHVSLVMAPPNASLMPGNHFYLVPFKHAPSIVDVAEDKDIWNEILKFQTSLQNLYAREGKGVILLETVLANKGFWQTKIEVVPVPFSILQDAPMFFNSAMREQTEEWGTHNKLLKTTSQRPLPHVVPKGFPYFSVEWGKISTSSSTGYAQIVESQDFGSDFGLDVLAGMLEIDPIRFHRKKKFGHEEERRNIADFLPKWGKVDWTKELDAQTTA